MIIILSALAIGLTMYRNYLKKPVEGIDQKVVFFVFEDHEMLDKSKYPDGYYPDGKYGKLFYIDNTGRKISYTVKKKDVYIPYCDSAEILSYLENNEWNDWEKGLSKDELKECYEWLQQVDLENCEYETKEYHIFDGKAYYLIGVRYHNGEPEFITLYINGDRIKNNLDPYAKKINEILLDKYPLDEWGKEYRGGREVEL